MSRLHIYTVHVDPSAPQPYEAAEFVEEGFSAKAFVFPFLWLLYFRLWWHALGMLLFNVFLLQTGRKRLFASDGADNPAGGAHVLIGFHANDWRRWRMRNKGYLLTDLVTGDSKLRAELRFFRPVFRRRLVPARSFPDARSSPYWPSSITVPATCVPPPRRSSAWRAAGVSILVTSDPADLARAGHIVLPGVGAFADCMRGLQAIPGMRDAMEREVREAKKPFLGICVGMQIAVYHRPRARHPCGAGLDPGRNRPHRARSRHRSSR